MSLLCGINNRQINSKTAKNGLRWPFSNTSILIFTAKKIFFFRSHQLNGYQNHFLFIMHTLSIQPEIIHIFTYVQNQDFENLYVVKSLHKSKCRYLFRPLGKTYFYHLIWQSTSPLCANPVSEPFEDFFGIRWNSKSLVARSGC